MDNHNGKGLSTSQKITISVLVLSFIALLVSMYFTAEDNVEEVKEPSHQSIKIDNQH